MNNELKEEDFIDSDVVEIEESENETNLITKLNTPINIILIVLIFITFLAILLVSFLF